MSDIGTTTANSSTDAGAPVSTPSTAPAAPSVPPPSPPASSTDPFAELATDQHVFDRGYVERIRREGQRYRTEGTQATEALAAYNQAFDGYDAADRQVWLDLATTWATDPNRAAQVMQNIARAVLEPEGGSESAAPTSQPPASPTEPASPGELSPLEV